MIIPDGIDACAMRETEFHPATAKGQPITAWGRRAETLKETIAVVNQLSQIDEKLDELLARPW